MPTTDPLAVFLDLARAHAVINRRFDATLGGLHGLGLGDLQLLLALEGAPEHKLRRVDLARALGVTASGVTWMLRPLTKRRLVKSERSTEDARVTFAVLTDAGHRLVADATKSGRELSQMLVADVSKQQLRQAQAVLGKLGEQS